MKNQPMKEIVDKVVDIMAEKNFRLYDSDLFRTLNYTTFDYSESEGFHHIVIDTSELISN